MAQPIFDSPKKTFTHDKSSGITPPDVRGEERDRVQAILRASKGWETAHPGIRSLSRERPTATRSMMGNMRERA